MMQLMMVPLQNTHTANSLIQSDRMLMVSGYLADTSFGNASSALFDGEMFIPYIVSETASGLPGVVSGFIYSLASFSFAQTRKYVPSSTCQTLIHDAQISSPLV